jgi:membrane protein implicated in regulation of membrane protease activity
MDTDLIGGLLLTAVLLLGVGYLIKEIFGPSLAGLLAKRSAQPPADPNRHLIGAIGRVTDTGEQGGDLRVRVGIERWNARLASSDDVALAVGAEVEVKGVHGRVLEVAARTGGDAGVSVSESGVVT